MNNSHPPQVLTLDLEDWFHPLEPDATQWGGFERRIEIGTDRFLALCEKYGCKATIFVLGDVAEHAPQLVEKIARQGHEIGSHGMNHRFIYSQSPDEFRNDVRTSVRLLESITGKRVRSYRAPYFSITAKSLWALKILQEEGIRYDSSIFPAHNHRYGIPGARRAPHQIEEGLWEWPMSVFPTRIGNIPFAGGAYLRLLPWYVTAKMFSILEKRREPVIFYLHPWELDYEQPRIRCGSRFLRFRHYYDLHGAARKLENLMKLSRFVGLEDGIAALESQTIKEEP